MKKKDLLKLIDRTISSGDWVGGKNTYLFEKKIAKNYVKQNMQ